MALSHRDKDALKSFQPQFNGEQTGGKGNGKRKEEKKELCVQRHESKGDKNELSDVHTCRNGEQAYLKGSQHKNKVTGQVFDGREQALTYEKITYRVTCMTYGSSCITFQLSPCRAENEATVEARPFSNVNRSPETARLNRGKSLKSGREAQRFLAVKARREHEEKRTLKGDRSRSAVGSAASPSGLKGDREWPDMEDGSNSASCFRRFTDCFLNTTISLLNGNDIHSLNSPIGILDGGGDGRGDPTCVYRYFAST
ncbi:hypothetical protein Anapl_12540 [Anas platyrhynchos]|uniref:Uncharacterized protein n=1 Tax=Anas platyrhynchos TaxID=8839 RepID=R0KW26_ANAPL|nr:hypothetical protein Anapl_12540 [Anas platyrhynchos]